MAAPTLPGDAPLAAPGTGRRPRRRRWIVAVAGALVLLLAAAAVCVFVVLPWYVRSECIAEAAAHGITLSVDDAAIDTTGFQLLGVQATAAALPGAKAVAAEIDVTTSGLTPQTMTVHRAEITLAGRWSAMEAGLAKLRGPPGGGQGGAKLPESLVMDESRIVWPAPFAENARLEASNVHLDTTWGGSNGQLHARSDNVDVTIPAGKLGPWRLDVDRTPAASRSRLALDPAAPETCTVTVVENASGITAIDAAIPRSPLARLGVPPSVFGVKGKNVQAELTAHYLPQGPARADVTAKGGLYGLDAGLPSPLDVSLDLTATGAPASGLEVKKSRLAAGPLVGNLTGKIMPYPDGFRVELAWSADPVPCTAFDAPLAEGDPFDIAFQLRKLAAGVGMIQGDVSAKGTLELDTRNLGAAHVAFSPEVKCKVSLFGM